MALLTTRTKVQGHAGCREGRHHARCTPGARPAHAGPRVAPSFLHRTWRVPGTRRGTGWGPAHSSRPLSPHQYHQRDGGTVGVRVEGRWPVDGPQGGGYGPGLRQGPGRHPQRTGEATRRPGLPVEAVHSPVTIVRLQDSARRGDLESRVQHVPYSVPHSGGRANPRGRWEAQVRAEEAQGGQWTALHRAAPRTGPVIQRGGYRHSDAGSPLPPAAISVAAPSSSPVTGSDQS